MKLSATTDVWDSLGLLRFSLFSRESLKCCLTRFTQGAGKSNFTRVYIGHDAACVVSHTLLSQAATSQNDANKAAVIFRIAAKNKKVKSSALSLFSTLLPGLRASNTSSLDPRRENKTPSWIIQTW